MFKTKLKTALTTALALTVLLLPSLALGSSTVAAAPPSSSASKSAACGGVGLTGADCSSADAGNKINDLLNKLVNILTFIVGIAAVVMIIVGGLKYTTSGGDTAKVSSAKSTIVYALIGLIIVALAQFIIRFVLDKV